MSEYLKSCPFCGSAAGIQHDAEYGFKIYCTWESCPVKPTTWWHAGVALARKAWNCRAIPPERKEQK